MNNREKGFLLLSSHLGKPERKPLTNAQLRTLALCMKAMDCGEPDRELMPEDLIGLGIRRDQAQHILTLLNDGAWLEEYLDRGASLGCIPLSRISPNYPALVRSRLGQDAPGCIWIRGDQSLLYRPAVALVGSRDIRPENQKFAWEVGRQAARQGYVLISGNARGADRIAQDSCLEAGGSVISIVADSLSAWQPRKNVLYLSEDAYDLPFSAPRALSRNRLIHCMGSHTFVAQCTARRGGTWSGTMHNLKGGWSQVFCFRDGSPAVSMLEQMGAASVSMKDLHNFSLLDTGRLGYFD